MRKEGSSVLEVASGAMKTPEIVGDDEKGGRNEGGRQQESSFPICDPRSAAVEVLCSYWGDQHQFLNRSPYVDASLECG